MFLTIPTILLAAALTPTSQGVVELQAAREAAFTSWANDSISESLTTLAEAARLAAEQLNAAPSGEQAELLAAELEFTLTRFSSYLNTMSNPPLGKRLLEGVTIPPHYGGAHAALSWINGDPVERLAVLTNWEFVGPFDNERGAGMESPLIAQVQPNETEYAGKVRPVSWRTAPGETPRHGLLRFGRLLDPATQACTLARSWVEAPEATNCLMQFTFEQEVRIWLNGVPIFEALGEHQLTRDKFAVKLELQAGWNELAVLIGARNGFLSFSGRLSDEITGAPIRLKQVSAAPANNAPLELQSAAVDPSLTVTAPGARRLLGLGDSADDLLTRSQMEAFYSAGTVKSHPGRASAKAATEADPNHLRARVQHALTLHEANSSEEQDVNPWLHAIDAVLELDDTLVWAWRQKAHHAGWNQPTYQRALDQLENALKQNPKSIPALEMKLLLLEHLDQAALANYLREHILSIPETQNWPSIAQSCSSSLSGSDPRRLDYDLALFEAMGNVGALSDWRWRTSRSSAPRSPDLIEQMLEMRISRDPWSVTAYTDAARSFINLGTATRALELLDLAEDLAPDRSSIQFLRARAHILSGSVDRAIVALERELELDYSAEDERRLLEHLRSTGSAPFHEPYREPLVSVVQRVTIDPQAASQLPSREVLFRRVVVKVNPDGTAKRYFRTVERILSEKGARDRDAIRFSSFPNQEIRVLLADVASGDGQVQHARTGRTAGRMTIDLPPLNVGDVIDCEWRIDDIRPTFFGNYFGFNETFSPDPSVPVHESEIVILTSDDFPLQFHTRGAVEDAVIAKKDDGLTERRWIKKAILPVDPERLMPPLEESMAAVQASSYESWEAFGAWWWNLTEEEIRVSPEMAAKVAELTEGIESPLERLNAIYDFVVTDIRYNAWEFGVHGYQPYEAPVIFSRGFGDCKDKAILLRALLGETDIEAWPVLIRAESRRPEEDQALALVEHFNHCIAFVPEQEGIPEMFLDGTARHHPLEVLPAMDNGAKVLIVRADGVEQRTIPIATAEKNHVKSTFEVSVATDRSAQVKMTRSSEGRFDPGDRGRFTGSDEQRTEQAQSIIVGLFGPIDGEVVTSFSDLEDLGEAVSMEFEVRAKQVARPSEKGFELPSALSKFELLRTIATETERQTDLLLDVPRSNSVTTRYVLPPGSNPQGVPPAVHIECPDASYDWSATIVDGSFEIQEEFTLNTHRISQASYAAFRDFARKVDETQNAMLEVEVKP